MTKTIRIIAALLAAPTFVVSTLLLAGCGSNEQPVTPVHKTIPPDQVKVGDTKVLAPDNPFDQADQVKVGDTKVLAPDNPFDQADQVKVGDTKVLAPDNPFDQGEITRRVVIAVSGDYIQYRFEREDGYVGTNDCHWRAWGILSPPQPNPTITCTGVVDGVFDYEQGFVDPPVAEEDLPF